ncbi:glycoside hydrolase family 15 protein [Streptomyces koyangensis]|uniref:Glycoside hydrolase family 15 protein n=1 Tax=Streptomyces koyangensis TaxID=188770 RepID=A0ABX7EJP0_9ACTN|nr:glycoside hydrolase family 15 protein [Streptomyces koyangensis]QRF05081.1 glycoside hydrolase family 15 protein [Streptomyces koyangensis]
MTHTAPPGPGPGPGPTSGPTPEDPTPCPEGAEAPHAYLPIGEHGIIGDLRTAALVGTDGRIDWFCAPRFDSPSLFGGLLDAEKGGSWRIDPLCAVASRQQFYFPDTNILVTRMLTEDGIVEVQDFMPVLRPRDPHHQQRLVRRVTAVRGRMRMRSVVAPRMDYGRAPHRLTLDGDLAEFTGEHLVVSVRSGLPWQQAGPEGRDAETAFALKEGESVLFVLQTRDPGEERPREGITAERAEDLFRATATFWRNWLAHSTYTGRWREMVHRSALTLKLLTHEPTGALVAAPTLGLPEELGGVRNWDYRYVWIRDAAFSLYALLRLGFTDEAEAFFDWLARSVRHCEDGSAGPLRVLYSIDGRSDLPEEELPHLEGYRGASPVRVGNCAYGQLQLDVYGELFDAAYLFNKYGDGISWQTWADLVTVLDWLLDHWDSEDQSIWEGRSGPHRHTYSRVMCWVAVERMVRIARQRGLPADLVRWTSVRDEIFRQVMAEGWNERLGSFVQRLADGADEQPPEILDASLLLMPMVKFLSPRDERFRSTLRAISEGLVADSLVFRYDRSVVGDGVAGDEGTFSLCSFWWVEALTRTGQTEDARLALEKTFTFANHLGQYAEQVGVTGEQLGNFPQALTHLALISAAVNLDRAMG